jgi:hypothetical protein
LVGTVSLISAADAVASEVQEAEQAAQQGAAAAAATAADGLAAAAGEAAAAVKPKKKRRKPVPRPKPSLKPPGVIPRVKLADNLSVSKVGLLSAARPQKSRKSTVNLVTTLLVWQIMFNSEKRG